MFTSPRSLALRTGTLALAVPILTLSATACGDAPTVVSADADAVIIVADTHSNSPAPELNTETSELVSGVLANNGVVRVVRVSATPTIVDAAELKEVRGTDAGRAAIVKRNLKVIGEQLDTPSDADGADDLEAISMAADALRSNHATRPAIILTGSGLGDSGRLAFTAPGMLTANPDDVVAYLQAADALPDLQGVTTHLVGLGYTAGPQEPLDATQRENVTAIWVAVLEAAGATVEVSPEPRTGDALDTTRTVTPVEVPHTVTPAMCSSREIVFADQSKVSFREETDQFVEPGSAASALTPIAAWLAADDDRTALVRGTTADDRGDRQRLRDLGQTRADAVSERLVAGGARRTQITTVGVGADFPEYVRPDADASGTLLPGPASLNRSVPITLTDPC